ncbi:MBL fold metallo-hydrolase [Curtobacterium flaccumfaciens]|nr:MBL fold metallo-hydrolase [Curtobacterium flaccumfaciens]
MEQLVFGDVTVDRVEEMHGPIMPPSVFFPTVPAEIFDAEHELLVPHHMDAAAAWISVAIQTWVLRSAGRTILIDTGVGNDKSRPSVDAWDHNSHDFLGALTAAGVTPDDVDIVVNTHLHVDHVGWNTQWDGSRWIPTFKNATYLMPDADVRFWNPMHDDHVAGSVNENVFEDSVQPVLESGQVRTWSDQYQIDTALQLRAVPGHTPAPASSSSNPAAPTPSSPEISCTARYRCRTLRTTAASASTRPWRSVAAAPCLTGRSKTPPPCSPRISVGTERSTSPAMATITPSGPGQK